VSRSEILIVSREILSSIGDILMNDLRLPKAFKQLYRKIQRGAWSTSELEWLMIHTTSLPQLVVIAIREKLRICQERQS
jgi:hypothetical protein